MFKSMDTQEKHDWFLKLSQVFPEFACGSKDSLNLPSGDGCTERTSFTQNLNGVAQMRLDRPGLLFSSTSWTPDEDFNILFEALQGIFLIKYIF